MKNKIKFIVSCFVLSLIYVFPTHALALPAFPGAEGFGSQSVGGRGGRVIEVTNLNDKGAGSLRDAVETQSGPRIVVFRVSGSIQASDIIYIKNPYVTIAGQTSPNDGITLKGAPIFIQTNDVIIRGLKIRPGDGAGVNGLERDGISGWGENNRRVTNVIVDHNSITWGVDENTSLWDETNNPNSITFSYNIIAEALNCSIHIDPAENDNCHSMGMLIDSPSGNISIHHNLFASNYDRNPAIQSGNVEIINNLIYNWGIHPTTIRGGKINAIGNKYIKTAGSSEWLGYSSFHLEDTPDKIYLSGNQGPGGEDWNTVMSYPTSLKTSTRTNSPAFTGSGITTTSATEAEANVLSRAGALRDSIDTRIINYVKSGSKPHTNGWIIDSQNQVGGWLNTNSTSSVVDNDHDGMPDSWEQSRGGDLGASQLAPSGYTWVEEYINSFFPAGPVSASPIATPKPWTTLEADYTTWLSHYLQSITGFANGDYNDNGIVDGVDYMLWVNNYGK